MDLITQHSVDNPQSGSQEPPKDMDVNKGAQSSKGTHTSLNPSGTENLDASQEKKTVPVVVNLPELAPEPNREALSSSSDPNWRGSRRPRPSSSHDWKNWSSRNDWKK